MSRFDDAMKYGAALDGARAERQKKAAADPVVADGVVLTRASDIKMVPISWLWPGWLAAGKMHLLAGAPEQGKTTLAMAMAATVSSGGVWPDKKRCEPGEVLIWTGEDDPADTLNPRLAGMSANLERIHYITGVDVDGKKRTFDPARDMPGLQAKAAAIGNVRLIIVDPVVSAVAGDSHKSAEVRQGLQPLVDLAAALGAAALGITHLAKGTIGRDPTERVLGSIAFAALARVVLMAAKVKSDDGNDKRILVRSKSNISPSKGGFEYHVQQVQVQDGIEAAAVTWGNAVNGTARELLAEAEAEPDQKEGNGPTTAIASAEDFLRQVLKGGMTPATQVKDEASEAGLAWMTVRRAAADLGVKRTKGGMKDGWYWSLQSEDAQKKSKMLTQESGAPSAKLSTFGDAETTPATPEPTADAGYREDF